VEWCQRLGADGRGRHAVRPLLQPLDDLLYLHASHPLTSFQSQSSGDGAAPSALWTLCLNTPFIVMLSCNRGGMLSSTRRRAPSPVLRHRRPSHNLPHSVPPFLTVFPYGSVFVPGLSSCRSERSVAEGLAKRQESSGPYSPISSAIFSHALRIAVAYLPPTSPSSWATVASSSRTALNSPTRRS